MIGFHRTEGNTSQKARKLVVMTVIIASPDNKTLCYGYNNNSCSVAHWVETPQCSRTKTSSVHINSHLKPQLFTSIQALCEQGAQDFSIALNKPHQSPDNLEIYAKLEHIEMYLKESQTRLSHHPGSLGFSYLNLSTRLYLLWINYNYHLSAETSKGASQCCPSKFSSPTWKTGKNGWGFIRSPAQQQT